MDFFDHWLKIDTWTFKDAALLFNGHDPVRKKEIDWSIDIDSLKRNDIADWELEVLKTYQIFMRAIWKGLDELAVMYERTYREHFFILAFNKDLPVNEELRERKFALERQVRHKKAMIGALSEYGSRSNGTEDISNISTEMRSTLSDIIEAIEKFETSEIYQSYRENTQQQLVQNWLEELPNKSRDWVRTVKYLISEHYGLTSQRKSRQ